MHYEVGISVKAITFSLSYTACLIKFQMYHGYDCKNLVFPVLRNRKITECSILA